MKTLKYKEVVDFFNLKKDYVLTKISNEEYVMKGVLYSEAIFIYLISDILKFTTFVESGRAMAQSTTLLAKLFGENKKIITVEYDRNSPDVEIADKRLEKYKNVETIFGDSFIEIPKILVHDSIVFIDGPKMFDAVVLGLKLLRTGKIKCVFLHDTSYFTPERKFINFFFKNSLHSDDPEIANFTKILDVNILDSIPKKFNILNNSYGYNVSCIFFENKNYTIYIILARIIDFSIRALNKI